MIKGKAGQMKFSIKNTRGFTLLEIILVLILVGIVGAVAGLGIGRIAQGYILSREAADMFSKGQVAMARLTKDFHNISSVDPGSENSISYEYIRGGGKVSTTVSWDSATGIITLLDTLDADPLADNVSGFELGYLRDPGDLPSGTWSSEHRIIQITLQVSGPGGATRTFMARVAPRNL